MKILIEKAVLEQALETFEPHGEKYPHIITALREALDPELQFVRDWNEGKVRRVSDGKVMGFAEQAEQEPIGNISLWHNHGYQNHNVEYYGTLPDGLHQLYAAPVRTKDLTDDEILDADNRSHGNTEWTKKKAFARAVIAADRKLNKQTKENQE